MASFSSELGVQFETSLEAPHVIDVDSQVLPTSLLSLKFISPFSRLRASSTRYNLLNTGMVCYNNNWSW